MHCIAGGAPESVTARAIVTARQNAASSCNFSVQVAYANGSIGTLTYTDRGNPRFPRERIQVFAGGAVLTLDDFARLEIWGSAAPCIAGPREKDTRRRSMHSSARAAARRWRSWPESMRPRRPLAAVSRRWKAYAATAS
jgi:hypothetical protein